MNINEIKKILSNSGKFEVRDVEYNTIELSQKYGLSFEAKAEHVCIVKINNVECACIRCIEEFGKLLCIWNGTQIRVELNDIISLEVL